MKKNLIIFIAGSNRSGTTWLQNIIAAPLNYRLIFEPLHRRVVGNRKFDRLFLDAYSQQKELFAYLQAVLKGKIKNRWMLQGGHARRWYFFRNRWWARNVVVKFIRANLMLEWLEHNFPCRIVFIIRHPCAVIASIKKMEWDLKRDFDFLKSQNQLLENYLQPYQHIIFMRHPTPVQRLALIWCIENKIPLTQFKKHNWVGAIYEHLVLGPHDELNRIYSELGLQKPSLGYKMINKTTHTANKDRSRQRGDVLKKWQSKLSKDETKQIIEIVKAFDMGFYSYDTLPSAVELESLMNITSP